MRYDQDCAPDIIEFDGVTYKRMGGERKYYLSQSRAPGRRGAKGLHVAIWEYHNKTLVPIGHEIHHKDGNTFNFEPDNLECLPVSVHRSLPKRFNVEKNRKHLDNIRHMAAAWHGSPEGLEWHRKHAEESIRRPGVPSLPRRVKGTRDCVWCGATFQYKSYRKIFCSSVCSGAESTYNRGVRVSVTEYYKDRVQSYG